LGVNNRKYLQPAGCEVGELCSKVQVAEWYLVEEAGWEGNSEVRFVLERKEREAWNKYLGLAEKAGTTAPRGQDPRYGE
jgi:hypothetical protein